MMLSKVDSKKIGDRSGSEKLLNEIETISKALYVNKNPSKNSNSGATARQRSIGKTNFPDPKSKPRSSNEDPTHKDKKSIWSWKSLKPFYHVRNRRFNCCFSLQVHSIQGLPSDLDGFSLSVFWKRRDGLLVTRPKKVVQGKVEFEEELNCTCTVNGSGNGPHHSAKYEAKHFLLYASVYGATDVDLGKHRVDLTRFLPLTLEELEEEKSSGKWATSFKLSGKAKGATMNVSFGYTVVGNNLTTPGNHIGDSLKSKQIKSGIGKSKTMFGEPGGRSGVQNTERPPGKMDYNSHLVSSGLVDDVKDLHEVLPIPQLELAKSVDVLYKKFDDGKLDVSVDSNPVLDVCTEYSHPMKSDSCSSAPEHENADVDCGTEFSFVEQGIEVSSKKQMDKIEVTSKEHVEKIDVKDFDSSSVGPEIDNELLMTREKGSRVDHQEEKHDNDTEEFFACNSSSNDYDTCTKESILKELESALSCVSELEIAAMESPEEEQENNSEFKSSDETTGKAMSLNLDDDLLEGDFLRMLGIEQSPFGLSSESEPESPREQLLRQFEEEAVAGGYSLFNFDTEDENHPVCGYNFNVSSEFEVTADTPFDLPSTINANEGMYFTEDDEMNKMKAKMLEDLETEVLMHEWGLNEEAFQQSPPSSSHGFGSPVDLPCGEPFELPPLGEGLGSFIQTKNGGFLRSMDPAIFQNAKSGGNLILQVSTPVVVPAEMGSGIMEILQRLASVGIEKLSMQANKLMPLEDITGKTMQQVAWEAIPTLEGHERQCMPQNEPVFEQDPFDRRKNSTGRSTGSRHEKCSSNSVRGDPETEYVSLEGVAPLALDKIEALSIEGLRIQSGMSEEAPSNISAQSIGEFSALRGKGIDISGSLGLEGTAGLQLLDIKDNGDDVDGLMGLSLSLDEWMRLDSGELDDEEIASEHTSKILAAHHANSLDFIRGGAKGDRRRGKSSSRKCGLLGNNFTVALMVQLRDPLRNYEPVGAPMLSLIQVERVFIPPKPKIYSTVLEIRNNYDDEDDLESVTRVGNKEEPEEKTSEHQGIPQFRITEVHVAGIKTEPNKKLWGTSTSNQQKSGSRWLLANGMGKNKHPFLKTKAAPKFSAPEPTKVRPGDKDKDSLWSISSGAKWNVFSALNPLARNPNVVFPNENMKLR